MMKNMIRENAYIECPQLMYWRIVQSIIEDLKTPGLKVNGLRYDEHIFARFCLLAASALGNCTWESSFKDLFRLTLADFKPILSGIHHLEGYGCYLSVPRKKTHRPIFMNRF
ncbi:MAG: hypothetical protein Q8T08_18485, partial [Ignavibacteria bacterium]|nr:hypothetical protein [Ignavibacteria bacterium]